MTKYIFEKTGAIVEAYQYTGDASAPGWPKDWIICGYQANGRAYLNSCEKGSVLVERGDWVIKDEKNQLSVCDIGFENAFFIYVSKDMELRAFVKERLKLCVEADKHGTNTERFGYVAALKDVLTEMDRLGYN